MQDQFIGPISAILATLGYTVSTEAAPQRNEYESTPIVLLSPRKKPKYQYHAFGFRNVVSEYEVFYVTQNDLINICDPAHNQFSIDVMTTFQPQDVPVPFLLGPTMAGAWECRVDAEYDFDRNLFLENYAVTGLKISLQWIMD